MSSDATITLFLCGDVMTGRGIDQVLPHPSDPALHEPFVTDARAYVGLAEEANGPIPKPAGFAYVWGEALAALESAAPEARILPLETAVTTSDDREAKGIHYRMHPANVPCLAAARPDVCVLANNHVLDWGVRGLEETLDVLHRTGIKTAGAGRDAADARAPAIVEAGDKGRILVFGFGHPSSGIPFAWAAAPGKPGVSLLPRLSKSAVAAIAAQVRALKRPGDVVVASIHWGGNWGYRIPAGQRAFAHALIERAGVDLVHGHSSHHAKGIEVYRGHLVLYGCGDLLTDYEGIHGHEEYRADLGLMYFPAIDPASGRLEALRLVPMRIRNFRLKRAAEAEAQWLLTMLNREGRAFGTGAARSPDGSLRLTWDASACA